MKKTAIRNKTTMTREELSLTPVGKTGACQRAVEEIYTTDERQVMFKALDCWWRISLVVIGGEILLNLRSMGK